MRTTSKEILNDPISQTIFKMTMPMIIGILILFSFQFVDMYFIGILGAEELAAISFTLPVTQTITNVAIGLGIGSSIMIAKSIGKDDSASAAYVVRNSLLLTLIISIVVTLVGLLSADSVFSSLGASKTTLVLIHQYMDTWLIGVVLLLVPYIASSAVRATGDTEWPSKIMIGGGLVNIIFDPILIFGFGPIPKLGLQGAAIATLLAGIFNAVAFSWILYFRDRLLALSWPTLTEFLAYLKTVAFLCLPIVLTNIIRPVMSGIITAEVAEHGETAVAGFGAGSRFELIYMVVAFALTAALSPFIAQNLGAKKKQRAIDSLTLSLKFACLFYLLAWFVTFLCASWFAQIFSDDPSVIQSTQLYLQIMPASFLFYGLIIIVNTGFNAAHKSMKTLAINLIWVFACVMPCMWVGNHLYGLPGLYWGIVLGGAIATVLALVVLKQLFSTSLDTE